MLKKDITYKNYDEESVTETFWFHISKAELVELRLVKGEGYEAYLNKIIASENYKEILPIFKEIIALSIGRRDEEKKTFVKDPDYAQSFMSSEAYSELFMEFLTDVGAFVTFVNGVVPKDLSEQIHEAMEGLETPAVVTKEGTTTARQVEVVPLPKKTFEECSDEEIMKMSDEEFAKLTFGADPRKMTKEMLVAAMQRATRK